MKLAQVWSGAYLPLGTLEWRPLDLKLVITLRLSAWRHRAGLYFPVTGSIRAPGLATEQALRGMAGITRSGMTCEACFQSDDARAHALRATSEIGAPPTVAGWSTLKGGIWVLASGGDALEPSSGAGGADPSVALCRIRLDWRKAFGSVFRP